MKNNKTSHPVIVDGETLTPEKVFDVAVNFAPVKLSPDAISKMKKSRQLVEKWVQKDEVIYGVTTGFGDFATVKIEKKEIEKLQRNLIFSHSAGAGEPLPPEVVRAMMLLRANALSKGYSGVRVETVKMLIDFLNLHITPIIPSQGSVGSSGDLVQLSHLVLAMMGEGNVWVGKDINPLNLKKMKALSALKKFGLEPIRLSAKEGLALINGTQMMTAYACLIVKQAKELCKIADIAASLSIEALKGTDRAFDERIHKLRPYQGQQKVARNILRMMKNSEIRLSHLYDDPRVQDAYSLRCVPQIHGASRDAIDYVYEIVSIEVNSATDNPLIFPEDEVHLEGGNFHGQPIALAMDFIAIALSELANVSERRIERLVNAQLSGLPKFLTTRGGLNSGLMIAQYTAASLVSENKVLAHPASVDSIPTSANQEDHNSMGSISAQKAYRVLKNVQTVLAIEIMCAAQGIDFAKVDPKTGKIMRCGIGTQAAYEFVRKKIKHLDEDRILHNDIVKALEIVRSGEIINVVEKAIGEKLE
ncbi:histidine ammonia-lyase [Candidatus Kryptobacter tengchongensis]|uniref:Histidine ammonia-lyase n=1 Tax=Kryptobacter tengchongensis TaxID=1643429 RepID=A0A656D793_KRYT1|nr:histidine ammonia-lyase [Candidatus Kryptobacter tengchongensis]CUS99400.1 histidine ammonia-lyase [Candidatus Kryptobacter tengchongensis]CUU00677.1 histidine ammonia-lyase [Candidatus Kryptobacter tengchongensis]